MDYDIEEDDKLLEMAKAAAKLNITLDTGESLYAHILGIGEPSILDNFGVTMNYDAALKKYRAALPWWRRWFWPRLSTLEKQRAILNAILEVGNGD